jgi:hypothetical protein
MVDHYLGIVGYKSHASDLVAVNQPFSIKDMLDISPTGSRQSFLADIRKFHTKYEYIRIRIRIRIRRFLANANANAEIFCEYLFVNSPAY